MANLDQVNGAYQNTVYVAKFVVDDAQTYVVSYNTDGNGTAEPASQSDQVLSNSSITGSVASANDGYAFDGWYKGDTLITRKTTLNVADAVDNLNTNPSTGVYMDTTYTACFDVDVKGDPSSGDPEDKGDDIPDKYQTIFEFVSAGNGTVTGDGIYQTITGTIGGEKPVATPSIDEITVTPDAGYAFDYWIDNKGTVYWNLESIKAVSTSEDLTFTAHFDVDVKGDPNSGDLEDKGDDIPDKYQTIFEFVSAGNGTVTGDGIYQTITGTIGGEKPVATPSIDEITVTPDAGYAFDYWIDNNGTVYWNLESIKDVSTSEDLTFTAHFDVDVKGNPNSGDPEDKGDDIPDKYQTIFEFVSAGNGTVTGDGIYQTITGTIGGEKPVATPSIDEITVTPDAGYAFDYWIDNNGTVYWNLESIKDVSTSEDLTFTAHFDVDEKGGGDDGEEPDGIPDKDQVKVTFDVVNGTWTEGGNGQKFAWLVLRDENGNRSENGSAVATMPGTTPINGYSNGVWSPADTKVTKDSVHAFVCTYSIRTDLSYTVRYLEDGTARELNGAKVVGGQTFGATVTESAINIPGYTMTSDKNPQSITIGTGENVITFYYKEIGPDVEPTPTETPTTPTIPTTPTTPTTPAGPTTPTVPATGGPSVTAAPEATQAPAEEEIQEEIQEEETPLAPEAGEGEEETIGEGETPLAGGNAAWALLNLILTILTALGSLILLIGYFIGRNRREEEDETTGETRTEYEVNRHGFWRLVSLIPGIGAIIVFILTEDMSLPMVFVDKWTLLMVIIAVIQIVIAVLSMRNREEPDEDDQANA